MARQPTNYDDTSARDRPELEIPVFDEPTPDELARRQRVVERIHELRKRNGSIGIASDDLLHEARQEDDERVNGWFTDK